MQQRIDLVEHESGGRARLVLVGAVRALQQRLGELQIPVAEDVPDEAIGGGRRVVEAIGVDRRADLARPRAPSRRRSSD